jgi:hypothetical protein
MHGTALRCRRCLRRNEANSNVAVFRGPLPPVRRYQGGHHVGNVEQRSPSRKRDR